jgi:hypothetical protein
MKNVEATTTEQTTSVAEQGAPVTTTIRLSRNPHA